jgi:hypothetical protein
MNRDGNKYRLFIFFMWLFLGFFTVRGIINDLSEIQKNLDVPNPILEKLGK